MAANLRSRQTSKDKATECSPWILIMDQWKADNHLSDIATIGVVDKGNTRDEKDGEARILDITGLLSIKGVEGTAWRDIGLALP